MRIDNLKTGPYNLIHNYNTYWHKAIITYKIVYEHLTNNKNSNATFHANRARL